MSILDADSLTNALLLAMPDDQDHLFSESVVYICDHHEEGSLGLILNKPLNIRLGELFERLELPQPEQATNLEQYVLLGGPVEADKGFVLHPNQRKKFLSRVERKLTLTTSLDILESISQGQKPHNFLVTLGCATWSAGQLMDEIRENKWMIIPAPHLQKEQQEYIFETNYDDKYHLALERIGLKPWQLNTFMGNG